MVIDQIHRGLDSTIRPRLDHPEVAEAIKHGDIRKILQALPAGITRADIEDYLKQRCLVLEQGLLQNVQIKADEASLPAPDLAKHLLPIDEANALTDEDRALLADYFGGSGKAATAARGAQEDASEAVAEAQAFGQELIGTIDERIKQRDEFLFELEQAAFHLHLSQEMQSRQQELREELQRILHLVKEKKIAPEFALVALTKISVMESGLIMATQGKLLMNASDEQTRIAQSIQALDASNVGAFEMKKLELSQTTTSMGEIQQVIQMAMQKVQTAEGVCNSMLGDYFRTQMDLRRKHDARG